MRVSVLLVGEEERGGEDGEGQAERNLPGAG